MAWLFAPTVTGWWYDLHAGIVKAVLRAFGLHRTETVLMKLLQPHSLLVFMEAFMLYSFIVSRVSVNLKIVDRDP